MTLSRRAFLGLGGAAAAGAGAAAWLGVRPGSGPIAAPATTTPGSPSPTPATVPAATPTTSAATADRVLVVVQCTGGNDALNTLVPAGDGRYHDLRPTLGIAEGDALALAGSTYGLHPALAPLLPLWDAGQLAWLASIGFPGAGRSHFAELDRWWAGGGASGPDGWLGRWLDATAPAGDEAANPMRAVAIGPGAPALRAERARSVAVRSLENLALALPAGSDAATFPDRWRATTGDAGSAMERAVAAGVDDALAAIGTLAPLAPPASDSSTSPYGGTTLSAGLASAAAIVEAGVGTQVVLVGASGFDTHADQAPDHAALLGDLASGIAAFFGRLEAAGLADRVLLVTTSEFGRRAGENGSGGTDHGWGGVQLACGPGVAGGRVVGDLDLGALVEGDLPTPIDTRSLYATALGWLGGPVDEVLGGTYDTYDLVRA